MVCFLVVKTSILRAFSEWKRRENAHFFRGMVNDLKRHLMKQLDVNCKK